MAIDPFANCNFGIPPTVRCTLDTCCLAQSSFLYRPNWGGNLFFTIYFAILCVPQLWLGIRYRQKGFATGMLMGLILEVVGYAGRVMLHMNPFNGNAFLIYLICLTIGPVFITAGIYLSIARIISLYGQDLSYFKPRTIAMAFMTSDFISLILQAAGGGIANSFTGAGRQTGTNIMIAGLLLQVISLAVFLLYLSYFALQCRRGSLDMDPAKVSCRERGLFKVFLVSLLLATVAILVRSTYRVAELWQGFSGELWNNEKDFMILDGGMMSLAVLLLTVFHPGPAFKEQWHAANWSFKSTPPQKASHSRRRSSHSRRRSSHNRRNNSRRSHI
ncbi:RTA1-domain-containing protein [Macroventuria anomochaeta]|uniref:RTA1-domain-containing protein n=1 Tax=Macroventuria anomochaeta TaxID=301207 RepID=A0ACB6SI00_9PLEO|nr:RTA1-domain-containing protein [Macroventuria anomochaeta]KAF2633117.1 RTA1-domain-containing protein [Macroventuria anomochaeta]